MLRSIILSPDRELASYLHRVLADTGEVSIARIVDRYPDAIELSRLLRSHAPQVVFVSLDSVADAVRIHRQIKQLMPGVETVAVGRSADPEVLMDVMHAGLPEFLALPLELQCVTDCLGRLKEKRSRRVVSMQQSELLYSFLPAKPGCGATTLAVNSTLAVTRHHDATGLLMDFDLNSGMIRFMLKLSSTHSILDAAEYGASMDQKLWRQIATRYEKLDVVHSGTLNPEIRVENINIRHLLDFARRNYKVVTADLSGNLEKYSMEIMHESRSVFLVCTPELASLHLAREKLQYLQKMGLGDRVRLLLNRYSEEIVYSPFGGGGSRWRSGDDDFPERLRLRGGRNDRGNGGRSDFRPGPGLRWTGGLHGEAEGRKTRRTPSKIRRIPQPYAWPICLRAHEDIARLRM